VGFTEVDSSGSSTELVTQMLQRFSTETRVMVVDDPSAEIIQNLLERGIRLTTLEDSGTPLPNFAQIC